MCRVCKNKKGASSLVVMNLLIVSGFLGSGKTTLLLKLAKQAKALYPRMVIIENEAGDIGIDGEYLRYEGLQVQELYSGCVCCTLSVDLVLMLEKIEKSYNPDLTVIEASGIARPGDLVKSICEYAAVVKNYRVLTVVDITRYKILTELMFPLLREQIAAASVIVLSKTGGFDSDGLDPIIQSISKLNTQARVITDKETDFCAILGELF